MPELPETETIARDLDAALRGASIIAYHVTRADVVRGLALELSVERRFTRRPITRIFRRAKAIVIEFSSEASLVVVPRFTGALLISGEAAGPRANASPLERERAAEFAPSHPYSCLQFLFADGRSLQYVDVRRLGTVSLFTPAEYRAWDASLGPEPLDPALTAERFSGILRGSNRAVKTVLMDQKRLAGVGNIYANEALWRAGIRPTRRASAVTRAEAARLLDALRAILSASIALRGTTFRDFQDAYGGRGGYAKELKVYGRGGEACPSCGATLQETHKLEGRSTVWCRRCQR